MWFKKFIFFILVLAIFGLSGNAVEAASASRIHLSNNWAGYAALSDSYSGVSATWTVPHSTPTSKVISADAAWVGIGGITKDDLVQAGTQAIIRNGRTQYEAWYELLPGSQLIVPLTISPGDRVSTSINEAAPDVWRITITNLTTNQAYQTVVPYNSSHSSAEWIVERPLAFTNKATGYLPLSDFGDVAFEKASLTTTNGGTQTFDKAYAEPLIMDSSRSRLLAAPESQNGSSFTVSYLTASESSRYLRALRRTYTLSPETNVTSRTPHYQQIDTNYVIHVIFNRATN